MDFQYGPQSNAWFLGPTRVLNPNSISISSAVFTQLMIEHPILYNRLPFPSLKIALPMGQLDSPSN